MKRKIDLSTPEKAHSFIDLTGDFRGRKLANRLGITGRHSSLLADNINNYAHNKRAIKYCVTDSGRKVYERCCKLTIVLINRCQAADQIDLIP